MVVIVHSFCKIYYYPMIKYHSRVIRIHGSTSEGLPMRIYVIVKDWIPWSILLFKIAAHSSVTPCNFAKAERDSGRKFSTRKIWSKYLVFMIFRAPYTPCMLTCGLVEPLMLHVRTQNPFFNGAPRLLIQGCGPHSRFPHRSPALLDFEKRALYSSFHDVVYWKPTDEVVYFSWLPLIPSQSKFRNLHAFTVSQKLCKAESSPRFWFSDQHE